MADIDARVEHERVDLGDIRLHCVTAGTGPLVVLLHGFPQHWYCWRHVIPRLADAGYRVVAPDTRGHGGSDKPRGARHYRARKLVGDVTGLLDHFGAERAHLVGHDWGAMAAWYAGMLVPERLLTLSILDVPHPLRYLANLSDPAQRRKSWYVFYFQLPRLPERMLLADDCAYVRRMLRKDLANADVPLTDEDIERTVEAIRTPGHARGTVNYYRAAFRWDLPTAALLVRRITTPTVVLWGEHDRFLVPSGAEPPAGWVEDLKIVRFPEGSHWLPEHHPDAVARELLLHFERIRDPAA